MAYQWNSSWGVGVVRIIVMRAVIGMSRCLIVH